MTAGIFLLIVPVLILAAVALMQMDIASAANHRTDRAIAVAEEWKRLQEDTAKTRDKAIALAEQLQQQLDAR